MRFFGFRLGSVCRISSPSKYSLHYLRISSSRRDQMVATTRPLVVAKNTHLDWFLWNVDVQTFFVYFLWKSFCKIRHVSSKCYKNSNQVISTTFPHQFFRSIFSIFYYRFKIEMITQDPDEPFTCPCGATENPVQFICTELTTLKSVRIHSPLVSLIM